MEGFEERTTPPINEPRVRDYLSFSAISTYQACPLRYFFRYVLGLPEETISSSLVFGSAIHSAVQFHFERLLVANSSPDLDSLLDVFQAAWQVREGQKIVFNKGEDINSIGRLADRILRAFQTSSLATPRGQIICVEEELRGELIPGLPDLLARVDLIVDESDALMVTDFKTARTSWSQKHASESASQLLLYHELVKELSDGRPVKLSFAVLTKTKMPELAIYPLKFDRHQVDRTKRVVERVWKAILAEHFYPAPSPLQCPSCPFREPCSKGRW
jgi:CRISPR/Cas system-associated exonuclease Cas4 (RecB family)